MKTNPSQHAWICRGCGESIEWQFETCFQCGTSSTGEPDPLFEPEIDAVDESESRFAQSLDADQGGRRPLQFTLRGLMLVTFALCGLFSIAFYKGPLIVEILLAMLAANLLGVAAAAIVTYGFGLPNDGSNPVDRHKLP